MGTDLKAAFLMGSGSFGGTSQPICTYDEDGFGDVLGCNNTNNVALNFGPVPELERLHGRNWPDRILAEETEALIPDAFWTWFE